MAPGREALLVRGYEKWARYDKPSRMDDQRVLRARAEAEAEELRDELARMAEERLRIARRNERLTGVLLELRAAPEASEGMQQQIDDALDYDGRDVQLELRELLEDTPDE